MAADSRLTLTFSDPNFKDPQNPNATRLISVPQSDANRKLFLAHDSIGISTCGDALISGVPISGFIESFILSVQKNTSVEDVAEGLLKYFVNIDPKLNTLFHVAGYSQSGVDNVTEVWLVSVSENGKSLFIDRGIQDGKWNGELDIIQRLFAAVYMKDQSGNYQPIFHPGIPMGFLTLQDAVDLAVFAVRTTIEAMRFQPRLRTVGGPIDVLTIEPEGGRWLQNKELVVR